MQHEHPPEVARAPFLMLFMAAVVVGGFAVLLVVASGGLFVYVLYPLGGLFLVGLWHYLLWGKGMHRQTEGEREEERVRDTIEGEPW